MTSRQVTLDIDPQTDLELLARPPPLQRTVQRGEVQPVGRVRHRRRHQPRPLPRVRRDRVLLSEGGAMAVRSGWAVNDGGSPFGGGGAHGGGGGGGGFGGVPSPQPVVAREPRLLLHQRPYIPWSAYGYSDHDAPPRLRTLVGVAAS